MVEYSSKIAEFIEGFTDEKFLADERTIFAVIHCFEVIGEAAGKIPKPLQTQFPEIPWPEIISFRNYLIHEYDGVEMKRVWISASKILPETLPHIKVMLTSIASEEK